MPFIVTNTAACQINIANQAILPGAKSQPIDDSFRKHVETSSVFKAGMLVMGEVTMPKPKPLDISRAGEAQAKRLIAKETDVNNLRAWTSDERPEVAKAASARIAALSEAAPHEGELGE